MDPSLSVTSDPHHPPPFTSFPPFTNPNPYAAANHPFYGGAPPNNNQFYQVPPNPAPVAPPNPSFVHPPYSDMICTAIAALNEPDGSSKQAISRYIERIYTGIPPAHGALLTHHLRTLKANGILTMVKKSYKFAATPPPTSVAVAAAAASGAPGFEPPRSDFMSNPVNEHQPLPDPAVSATPLTQKRGRGRPPKPKPDVQVQHIDVSQANGKPTWEQNELTISRPEEVIQAQPQPPVKRPPGRPRKDGALPTVKAASSSSGGVEIAKRRGRPPSGRAAGRERKPAVVSAPVSVYPYVANGGVRRRGRPRRVDAGASSVPAAAAPPPPNAAIGGELVVVAKRGRGRPPKVGGVIRKPLKRGYFRTGRPVGRPRKNAVSKGPSGQQAIGYGELKKKFELFQEKAKRVVDVLKAEMVGKENQAVAQAIQDLEELTVTTMETTEEPQQHMVAVQPDEHHPEAEPEAMQEAHHPETEPEGHGQSQTEAEAMQEALF